MASSWSSSPEAVGLGSRLAAFAIDALLLFVVMGPLALFGLRGFVFEALVPALAVLAFWRAYGATPGKMAVGARIVDAKTGGKPSTGQLIGRYLAYYVSIIQFFLGLIWVGIDAKKQGFHDKLAGTVVIRER